MSSRKKRTTIFTKILAADTIVITAALAVLAASFYFFTSKYLGESAADSMALAGRLAQTAIRSGLDGAGLTSRQMADNYGIKVGLKTQSMEIISDRLKKELLYTSADFISVAGRNGVTLCSSSRVPRSPEVETVADTEPLFLSPSFQKSIATHSPAAGIEPVYPNGIGMTAVAPILDELKKPVGFIRIGYLIDGRFIERIKGLSGADLAVEYRGAIIAASVPLPNSGEAITVAALGKTFLTKRIPLMNGGKDMAALVALYPKSKIERVQKRGLSAIAVISFFALFVSVVASARISRKLTTPIRELATGAERIKDGDLSYRIKAASKDELGALASGFNLMAQALQQRETELRENQDQLVESGKLAAIGELAAGVAHEIGNPLAAIFGYIQLLRDAPPEKRDHFLEEMTKEVGFIDATIRELLDFSRPAKSESELFAIDEAVDEALRMLSFHKMMKHIEVDRVRGAEADTVSGSKKEIVQAVLNITINAAQAMNGHGKISIAAGRDDGACVLRIKDSGPGIPQSDMSRIFDPFFTTKRGGSGLGLSITYRIMQRHGGSVSVVSAPGEGSEFTLKLPVAANAGGGGSADIS